MTQLLRGFLTKQQVPSPPSTTTQPGSRDLSNRITLISHSPSVTISRVLMEKLWRLPQKKKGLGVN